MPEPEALADVIAAGAVVLRRGRQVLLVHRPRYDDWSFPKGKLDPGEHEVSAAVREVAEETGLHIRLGVPLAPQRYPVAGGRTKVVHYWIGRTLGADDVSGYLANAEIDQVAWVPLDDAPARLTYEYDRQTLAEALRSRKRTHALVVLRHGNARPRKSWTGDDRQRPLLQAGTLQAQGLVPLLAAYDVTAIVTSSSLRCVETVAAYAETTGFPLVLSPGLSEEEATKQSVDAVVEDLLAAGTGAVLCTHRPVIPQVGEALGLERVRLEPAELLVLHHRYGIPVAVERHRA